MPVLSLRFQMEKYVAGALPRLTLMATLKAVPALRHLIPDTEGADRADGWHREG